MPEQYRFTVNGQPHTTAENKPLLRYLRDDLHLYSVKDGCSEGACGTCTIIVDGAATRACILTTKRADGKAIQTVEGLSDFEKEAFVYAFGTSGSVQCGFCTPGMVMAGKALLDKNPDPSEEDIKKAIRGNLCRCTGYRKIIDGIRLAASILRGETKIDPAIEKGDGYGVGQRAFRVDVRKKVLGTGKYPDDIDMEGMAHLSAVRSKHARARVLSIDASGALALPGVVGVLTAEDVPHNKVGHIQQDWDVMIPVGGVTRCVGDALCLVVAETEEILKQAKALVKVEYEVLKPVCSIAEAMAEGAPKVHSAGNLCHGAGGVEVHGDEVVQHTVYRARLPGARVRGGLSLQGRRKDTEHGPGRIRHPEGSRHHVRLGPGARSGRKHAGGRRLRRQGGRVRAAHRGAGRVEIPAACEGPHDQAGIHRLPSQAPRHGGHVHPRL